MAEEKWKLRLLAETKALANFMKKQVDVSLRRKVTRIERVRIKRARITKRLTHHFMTAKRIVGVIETIDKAKRVVVTVSGGVAEVAYKDLGVALQIIDYDVEGSGETEVVATFLADEKIDSAITET